MAEIVDKGELRRQLARSERERLDALATIETLEQKLREVTAERYAIASQLANIESQLAAIRAIHTVQIVLTICQAARVLYQLTEGSWITQTWRRLRGRPALVFVNDTVKRLEDSVKQAAP
jgi:uncharacterized protein YfcZ (UPF0381/DUF406 family)